jgi:flavin-dependent dehydrogenase
LDELNLDVEGYRQQGNVFQPIYGFRTSRMGAGEVVSRYDRPVSYGVRRCEFDTYLLNRSGARLRLGEPIANLRRVGSGWIVNEALSAPLLIGAGGHFCPVARFLGARPGAVEHAVTAQEAEFLLDEEQRSACSVDAELPELFFCRDLLGYGWCFRKDRYLNIGLGRLVAEGLSEHVAKFRAWLEARGAIPRNTRAHYRGHSYLVRPDSRRQIVADGVLLVGDAAGLAYPESGEGIRPAIESALLAAATITKTRPPHVRENLEPYQAALETRFGPTGGRSGWSDRAPAGLKARIGGILLGVPWFARKVVMEDWFLHLHEDDLRISPGTSAVTPADLFGEPASPASRRNE